MTDNPKEEDINVILNNLIEYNLAHIELRGQKIGSKLLNDVEVAVIKRGCKYSFLDIFSFQAKDFYVKLGYKEVFTLEDYPLTSKRHYCVKQLTENK